MNDSDVIVDVYGNKERSVSEVVENICNKVENSISKTLTSGIEYGTYTFNNEKDNDYYSSPCTWGCCFYWLC